MKRIAEMPELLTVLRKLPRIKMHLMSSENMRWAFNIQKHIVARQNKMHTSSKFQALIFFKVCFWYDRCRLGINFAELQLWTLSRDIYCTISKLCKHLQKVALLFYFERTYPLTLNPAGIVCFNFLCLPLMILALWSTFNLFVCSYNANCTIYSTVSCDSLKQDQGFFYMRVKNLCTCV